ncbi:MAG TPA: exodeoxyribonuclease III [Solirubrobacteraceae bacterium]|nr:exodeoxyribonuclease III [Solirubrobacteraceae bacterium]
MLLVTWNVNSLRARLPRVLELLAELAPDVVCLQETKCDAGGFPEAELAAAGYASHHHGAGRWAGVAILARDGLALEDPSCGLPGERAPDEARFCEATVGGLRVASAYVVNGREVGSTWFADKLAFLDAVRERAAALDVIAGDFNVAPADEDVYDPAAFAGATHVTDAERSRLRAILDTGMVDAYRALHPGERQFTWWDYRAGHFHKGYGLRIDLALLRSPGVAERLRACGIARDYRKGAKPSDHAPLLVELA